MRVLNKMELCAVSGAVGLDFECGSFLKENKWIITMTAFTASGVGGFLGGMWMSSYAGDTSHQLRAALTILTDVGLGFLFGLGMSASTIILMSPKAQEAVQGN